MSISLSFNIGNNPPALLIILFSPLFDIHSYIQFGAVFRVVYFMGSVQSFRHVTCIVQVQMMHISVFPSLYISVYVLFLTPLFYQVPEICSRPKNWNDFPAKKNKRLTFIKKWALSPFFSDLLSFLKTLTKSPLPFRLNTAVKNARPFS